MSSLQFINMKLISDRHYADKNISNRIQDWTCFFQHFQVLLVLKWVQGEHTCTCKYTGSACQIIIRVQVSLKAILNNRGTKSTCAIGAILSFIFRKHISALVSFCMIVFVFALWFISYDIAQHKINYLFGIVIEFTTCICRQFRRIYFDTIQKIIYLNEYTFQFWFGRNPHNFSLIIQIT